MRMHYHINHGFIGNKPSRIIIHSMAEVVLAPEPTNAWVFLEKIGLSAHSLIAPDGVNIRCRHDNEGAYHAKGHNMNSLGMEFLVPGEHDYQGFIEAIKKPYLTEEAYQAGLFQIREWINLYNIKEISRHSDIDPMRKKDPGDGFPWHDLLNDLGVTK